MTTALGPVAKARAHWRLPSTRLEAAIGSAAMSANLAGALVVFGYVQFLASGGSILETTTGRNGRVALAILVAYLAFTGVLGWVVVRRDLRHVRSWLDHGRRPTGREREATLSLPARQCLGALSMWLGGAVLFSSLNAGLGNTAREVVRLFSSIVMGGLVTSGMTFAAVERAVRPTVALALRSGEDLSTARGLGVRARLVFAWALGSGIPLAGIALIPLLPGDATTSGRSLAMAITSLALLGLVAGLAMTVATAQALAAPLEAVRSAVERVRDGDLDVEVAIDDGGEVGLLQAGIAQMVAATRERRDLVELFSRHVGDQVAQAAVSALASDGAAGLLPTFRAEQRRASPLFVDLIGSTRLASERPPDEVVGLLNELFACVVAAVGMEGGLVNKFEGDGALCIFGAPGLQHDHPARALRAALDLRARLLDRQASTPALSVLDAAIGVSSGIVVAGNVGAANRYEYTVIGDPVNEASRLSDAAKGTDARLLVAAQTFAAACESDPALAVRFTPAGSQHLRGRPLPTELVAPTA